MRLVSSIFIALLLSWSLALAEGTYGPELEFTNRKLWSAGYSDGSDHAADVNIAARDAWASYMIEVCKKRGDCTVEPVTGKYWYKGSEVSGIKSYLVKYKDGFWYQISLDPGVVEVQMKLTASEAREGRARIQEDVFDAAWKAAKLKPNTSESHLHEGVQSNFGRDLRLLRNHMVDAMNHQEPAFLFTPEGYDNAPPLSVLPKKDAYEKFERIIQDVDSGKVTTAEELGRRVRAEVYDVTFNADFGKSDGTTKYQYYNVNRLKRGTAFADMTVETRAIPNPQSAQDLLDWIELKDARNRFLKSHPGRVELRRFNPDASWQLTISNFRNYVEESGLTWERYRKYLPAHLRKTRTLPLPPTRFVGEPASRPSRKCLETRLSQILGEL